MAVDFLRDFNVAGFIKAANSPVAAALNEYEPEVQAAISSASKATSEVQSLFEQGLLKAQGLMQQGGQAVAGAVQDVSQAASDVAQDVGQAVQDTVVDPAGSVMDTVQGMGQQALEFAQAGFEPARDAVVEAASATKDSIVSLGQKAKELWDIGTSTPAKLLAKDLILTDFVKERSVINETDFEDDELEFMRELARKYGTGRITKKEYGKIADTGVRGTSVDAVSKGTMTTADRVYNSLSFFNITKDPETGEYFAEDQYDWNVYVDYTDPKGGKDPKTGRPRGVVYTTEQFEENGLNLMEELFKTLESDASEFDKAHNLAFLLGSRDYKDNKLDTGRKVKINLGKLD